MKIQDHGICVDEKRRRVQCNYCEKQVTSFTRLKYHLGGVGPDVTACEHVTLDIKRAFRSMIKLGLKRGRNGNAGIEVADNQELWSKKAERSIARYFYENGLEFSSVQTPSFREMLLARNVGGGQMELKFPAVHDLKGWMLQEELKEVQDHVNKVKDSWTITGCSILLDAWVDEKGRDLVAFLADCPAGPVYLKSFDVSDLKSNASALISLVDGIVEEVGKDNVVQIIACSASGWVGELGEFFSGNKRKGFWSVSVSHCFELVLERIGKLVSFGDIFDKVKKIPEFFNNNPSVLELFGDLRHGINMTSLSSDFQFLTPYLFVESIFSAKNNLAAKFPSGWNEQEGETISKVMNDSSFWESVERVVKCTSPVIHALFMFSTVNNQHCGYVYDIMDGIKKDIAKKFNHQEPCYKHVWDVIDDVWNNHLHSHIHAAGYFFNPTVFYSTEFHLDPQVATGLAASLVCMVKDRRVQLRIATQLDMYRLGTDCFTEACQADQISGISPVEWWAEKASQHTELQSLAIKILSQTCEGASKYKLKRGLAEKLLLSEGMSDCERQNLEDLAFIHYNLHLQSQAK